MPATQSAYRQFHGIETTVTKVYSDLLLAADEGQVSALCLLDMTAAFDTVEHDLRQPSGENRNTTHTMRMTSLKCVLQQRHLLCYESEPDP